MKAIFNARVTGTAQGRARGAGLLMLVLSATAAADFATSVVGTAGNGNGFIGTSVRDNFGAGGIGSAFASDLAATPAAVVETFSGVMLGGSSSSASADLARGQLKATAQSRGVQTVASGYAANDAAATAMLRDVVRVLGDIPTGSMVEFIIDYHGAVNGDATNSQLGDIRTSTNGLLTFTAQAPGVAGSTRSLRHILIDGSCLGFSGPSQGCTSGKLIDQQFRVSVPISNAGRNVFFDFSVTATALGAALADFGNTAGLALVLPAGLSFSSDSGVLLSTPVPLPATASMLGLALLVLGAGRRRVSPA